MNIRPGTHIILRTETDLLKQIPGSRVTQITFDDHNSHLLPFWGTTKKSPSALQKAEFSIDLLAVYLQIVT